MADIYVAATGSNTSPYDTWAKAATSEQTALALAVSGDRVIVRNTFTRTGAAATAITITIPAGVWMLSASWDGVAATAFTLSPGAIIATSTTGAMNLAGNGACYGMYFKVGSGTSSAGINICTTDGNSLYFEACRFWYVTTQATSRVTIGTSSIGSNSTALRTKQCSFVFTNTAQGILLRTLWEDYESKIADTAIAGVAPTTVFITVTGQARLDWTGTDISTITSTLLGLAGVNYLAVLRNVKTNPSGVTFGTYSAEGSGEIFVAEYSNTDENFNLSHQNYRGSSVYDGSRYVTADGATYDGTNKYSWLITGSNATMTAPYYAPWIDRYNADLSTSVTPYFEIVRDGSATAYNDDQAWAEFEAKTTSGLPTATQYSDRRAIGGTAAAQANGAGTGSWTGIGGTAKSMKVDAGSAFTPAEIGYMRGRIVVGANIVIVADPKIRGLATDTTLERVTPAGFINTFASAGGGGLVRHPGMCGGMNA